MFTEIALPSMRSVLEQEASISIFSVTKVAVVNNLTEHHLSTGQHVR